MLDRLTKPVRLPLDRRFLTVLAASTAVAGGAIALLLHAARPDPMLTAPSHEDRMATVRAFVQRQQEHAQNDAQEGGMGARSAPRGARYAVRNNASAPHLSRAQARDAVAARGIFAALGGSHASAHGVVSPFGSMAGEQVGDAFGSGGLGLTGHGAGGAGYGAGRGWGHGAGRGAQQGVPGPATPVLTPTLDPNGRFATTYRPGRGDRAWFDAAVARGELPAVTTELLADLTPAREPVMEPPVDRALELRVDLEREALAPAGGDLRMRLALRSAAAALPRPAMAVHLVMDVSGSMTGAPIEHARAAARQLVARLADGDHFSLVTFESEAHVVVREGVVGGRREAIARAIDGIGPMGGTNLSAGLAEGYRMAAAGPDITRATRVVMLLSDGEPTDGITDRGALATMAAQALQESGTETTSVGVGTRYDGALMAAIAGEGAGGYYYVPDSAHIADALGAELDARAQPVAQALELRVRLGDRVGLTEVYGSRRLDADESARVRAQEVSLDARTARRDRIARDRHDDREGGMRFFIPGFARDDRHVMLFGLRAPAGSGALEVATVTLRYKDRVTGRNVTVERPVRVRYADSDAASAATASASVQRTAQGFEAGRTLAEASSALAQGAGERAAALLGERVAILRAAARRLEAPWLAAEGARLSRVAALVGATETSPMALAALLEASATGRMR